MYCSQGAKAPPCTPPAKARGGLSIEISSSERPRKYRKEGGTDGAGAGNASSSRINVISRNFVGQRGRIHFVTLLYVQNDIKEPFDTSEHAAVAMMWHGPGVGKIAKDYRAKKKVSMLDQGF